MTSTSHKNASTDAPALVSIGVCVPVELLGKITERIRELDLNRSQYVRKLVKADLQAAGCRTEGGDE